MDFATLINQYGLLAVLGGSMLEGESMLLLAGYAAHRGYLDFSAVVAVAWLGAVLGDQAWFWLGRRHGSWLLARSPGLRVRMNGALNLIARHPGKAVLAMRFAWGLRTVLPVAIGISGLPAGRYFALNLLSAALWAPLIAGVGWTFGALITRHAAELHRYEHWLAGGLIAVALAVHWFLHRRAARKS